MIQRIQSLYIVAAIILMVLTSYLPLINMSDEQGNLFITYASGIQQADTTILNTIPLLIIVIATIAINACALFLFKNLMLQTRLLFFSILLQVGSYGLGAFYILQVSEGLNINPTVITTFPLIASIFAYIAIRAIAKDDSLLKSVDRIR